MDQVKIGNFIADIRKEKRMTQKELAEAIGVSDKAISKWECGNGMPEMSMLLPLCQELQINVNELLSGERLSEDSYSQKAEENIMNLMQEKEENNKQNRKHFWGSVLGAVLVFGVMLCVMLAVIAWTFVVDLGVSQMYKARYYLIDETILIPMLLVAVLMLCTTRLWKPFFRVFGIFFSHRKYLASEVKESVIALRMTANIWMVTGIMITALGLIVCFRELFLMTASKSLMEIAPITFLNIAIFSLGLFYGVVGKLLLLPIQSKLESIAEKLTNQL